jgi:hypothetical protein
MGTVFVFKKKKLFEVNFIVPIDTGDIVEYDMYYYGLTPDETFPHTQYKVVGRIFRYEPAFSGTLIINLIKK